MLKQYERCFACFEPNHQARHCKSRRTCNAEGCRLKHHPLLRGAVRDFPKHPAERPELDKDVARVCSGLIAPSQSEVLLSIVRARLVTNKDTTLEVNVLLDPGSEATLIREDIARQVDLTGPIQNIRLGTFHGIDPTFRSRKVKFQLRSLDDRHRFSADDALTVPNINVSQRSVDFTRLQNLWPHLKGIGLNAVGKDGVAVLLGMDIVEAHEQYRVLKPPYGVKAPRAIQTPFGWCIVGSMYGPSISPCRAHHVYRIGQTVQDDLTDLVKYQWSIESLGTVKPRKFALRNSRLHKFADSLCSCLSLDFVLWTDRTPSSRSFQQHAKSQRFSQPRDFVDLSRSVRSNQVAKYFCTCTLLMADGSRAMVVAFLCIFACASGDAPLEVDEEP
ncbi:hypothetical protein M513_12348 [Trichuris suis]|uniref:Peptidase A2 domain-containing protein n=1 Tax=Trichuris suis TaxID=68888 RepID=A0A085LP71_9BILA|nr:hypothetical protein M513_12348 [Trichuris suis]